MEPLLQLLLPLFPQRGIRAAPFRAWRSSSVDGRHQTAPCCPPACLCARESRCAHPCACCRVRSAAPSCRAPKNRNQKRPSALRERRSSPCSPP
ncbi:hypothetical protein NDU88_006340 [Pleurodeles waltl]|uniref:Secreted protein n=1 Tax=Pleurodeles waltl TaxID=8319 RepID=A0AAV7SPB1_PLEWA|nr:hypothetical protein NDU88_006340 [Pleurodeles waltl]